MIGWPLYSPDLNPIEYVWKRFKDILRRDFPKVHTLPDNEVNRTAFHTALKAAWDTMPQDFIDGLIDSMPRRAEAVRLARGWYTKY